MQFYLSPTRGWVPCFPLKSQRIAMETLCGNKLPQGCTKVCKVRPKGPQSGAKIAKMVSQDRF